VIKSIDETLKQLKIKNKELKEQGNVSKEFSDKMQEFITSYIEKLEDNFNTPEAIAIFHEFLKYVNTGLRNNDFPKAELESLLDMFRTFNQVLAIIDFEILNENEEIPPEILEKLDERNKAKKEKDFIKADKIRDELLKF
jgi:cysteinyl-tRNA synthetase